jgi:membrane-associated phospholipid phosphatase
MDKILAFLIWPAGMAVIVVTAALLASRARAVPARPGFGARLPSLADRYPAVMDVDRGSRIRSAVRQASWFLLVVAVGVGLVFAVMALLGQLVIHGGPTIDKPIYPWVITHQIHVWKGLMTSLTKIGNTWSTRMAVVSAAVCLAVTWRRQRWLPAFAFLVLSLVQRYITHAIHLTDHRIGPPGFPHGTFPSGGSERCVVFYGLIAYFLWREFSGRRETAIWAGAAVAAVAFNEGYSRLYLGMHWTTDVLSGWLYGILLLAVFILATRLVLGPPRVPVEAAAREAAAHPAETATAGAAGATAAQSSGAARDHPASPAPGRGRNGAGPPARPEAWPPARGPLPEGPR